LIFSRGGNPVAQARKMAHEIKLYGDIQAEQDEKAASSVGVERV
jgi:hypothetical protein